MVAPAFIKESIRKQDEIAISKGCYFDEAEADRIQRIIETQFKLPDGKFYDTPFMLMDWERNFIRNLFGWKMPDGTRRFNKSGVWIPKKNAKSTLAAVIALIMLVADGEQSAEIYSIAGSIEQAAITYRICNGIIRLCPPMRERTLTNKNTKTIYYPETNSFYKALSSDKGTKEGINWHTLIFEELHTQRTRELWDEVVYGGIARDQSLILTLSTAGYDKQSLAYEQYIYARSVRTGTIEDIRFLPVIFEVSENEDWTDPDNWRAANPSMGVTFSEDDFRHDFMEAQTVARKENSFRRYRLNQWVQQSTRWLSMQDWKKCTGNGDMETLDGQECVIGCDLSKTQDLTALVCCFKSEEIYTLLCHFFIPSYDIEKKSRNDEVDYKIWSDAGHITIIPGKTIEYETVVAKIMEWSNTYKIKEVILDPWNSNHLVNQLEDKVTCITMQQTFKVMNEPSKFFETLVLNHKIRCNNPVMEWCVGNVEISQDRAGNIRPVKARDSQKIDGVVAAILAIERSRIMQKKPNPVVIRWA